MNYSNDNRRDGDETRTVILKIIIQYVNGHGYPPTVREICQLSGLRSTSSVQSHLQKMLKQGMIETDAGIGSSRAIRIPGYKFVKEVQK